MKKTHKQRSAEFKGIIEALPQDTTAEKMVLISEITDRTYDPVTHTGTVMIWLVKKLAPHLTL